MTGPEFDSVVIRSVRANVDEDCHLLGFELEVSQVLCRQQLVKE